MCAVRPIFRIHELYLNRIFCLTKAEEKAEGKIQSLIILIQKKVQKGKTLTETAGELEETAENISGLYTLIKEHPNEDVEKIMELMKAK